MSMRHRVHGMGRVGRVGRRRGRRGLHRLKVGDVRGYNLCFPFLSCEWLGE